MDKGGSRGKGDCDGMIIKGSMDFLQSTHCGDAEMVAVGHQNLDVN